MTQSYFSKIFVGAKRETQDASAEPEGAKRPRMQVQSTKAERVERLRMLVQNTKPKGAKRPRMRMQIVKTETHLCGGVLLLHDI